jgi:hypothetical protein
VSFRANKIRLKAVNIWDNVTHHMSQMEQSVDIKPNSGAQVFPAFETLNENEVKLNFGPVIFNLPERRDQRLNLYIAATGWISFDLNADIDAQLVTKSFGTNVGYFRLKGDILQHVYGVHYDLERSKLGHPVFHSQLKSMKNMATCINDAFSLGADIDDKMTGVLKNVRMPSAQMDLFSVFNQLCADHLFGEDMPAEATQAFESALMIGGGIQGAACSMPHLNSTPGSSCFRSSHWYSQVE